MLRTKYAVAVSDAKDTFSPRALEQKMHDLLVNLSRRAEVMESLSSWWSYFFLPKPGFGRAYLQQPFITSAFLSLFSIHLFFMFPDLQEGPLDAYRQALVQNQHLADLALVSSCHTLPAACCYNLILA